MLTTLVSVPVVLIAALLVYASRQPDIFRVQRTTDIKAPPEQIFGLINDFHKWGAWSPYEQLDPAMSRVYSGAPEGEGAVYEWSSPSRAGAGRMEIIESAAPSRIQTKLDFDKPFEAHNTAEFTLEPHGEATRVTWAVYGPAPFMTRVVHVLINIDRLIGKDFESGLTSLKAAVEHP